MSILSSALNSHRAWARAVVVCTLAAVLGGLPMVVAPPPAQAAAAPDSWDATVAPMAVARSQFGAATGKAPDNRIYAIGGYNFTGTTPTAEVYTPSTNTWAPLPTMLAPLGRSPAAAATGKDGRIYVIGSDVYDNATVEAYNPRTNAWEAVAPLTLPGSNRAAVADREGRVYALGGYSSVGGSAAVERYDPDKPLDGWKTVAPMTKARWYDFAAVLGSDGRIFAVGGDPSDPAGVEAYEPSTDTWTAVAPLPTQRQGVAAAPGPDGRIYAIGGYLYTPGAGRDAYKQTVDVYDPAEPARGWVDVAPMSVGRENAAATLGPDGRIYAMGGDTPNTPRTVSSVEAYTQGPKPPPLPPPPPDPQVVPLPDTWNPVTPMGKPRQSLAAAGGIGTDRRVYAIGGPDASAEAYTLDTRKWSSLPPMLVARSNLAATTGLDGRVYAIGGVTAYEAYLNTVEVYDPRSNSWSAGAPMTVPRGSLAAVTAPDGRIYALGGGTGQQTVEVFDPAQPDQGWKLVAPMSVARSGLVAAVGSDGRIYAIGGAGDNTTVEAYTPATDTWAPAPAMPSGPQSAAGAAGPDGRIYVVGGADGGFQRRTRVFDPKDPARGWTEVAKLIGARYTHAAARAADGRIYAMGGYGTDNSTPNSVEAYTSGSPAPVAPPSQTPLVSGAFTEYPIKDNPMAITGGPDGNLWFTQQGSIGRMTRDGKVDYFKLSATAYHRDITAGPDGNLWFTDVATGKVGRITPQGAVTEFPVIGAVPPGTVNVGSYDITAGPDGNLWFTIQTTNEIGRITPTGTVTRYGIPTAESMPTGIAAGPDGNVWFTENAGNNVGRVSPAGTITEFAFAAAPTAVFGRGRGANHITAGPDGNMWFTISGGLSNTGPPAVARISPNDPAGKVSEFILNKSYPQDIAVGADGNLWMTDQVDLFGADNRLLRMNPKTLRVSEFPAPKFPDDSGKETTGVLGGITAEPGGNPYMWFTKAQPGGIGRFAIGGDGANTYLPSGAESELSHCKSTGDPSANFARTRTRFCMIGSAGPLDHVIVSPFANCQVYHQADSQHEHYDDPGEGPAGESECGTFISTKPSGAPDVYKNGKLTDAGVLYGPKTVPCYFVDRGGKPTADGCAGFAVAPDKAFEFVDQVGVSGSGTPRDPYAIVTTYKAGDMLMTQTDSYVVGRESYRTDLKVTNTGAGPADAVLTRSGDCWLQNSDNGIGRYDPETGAIACKPEIGSRILEWQPISPGSHWMEGERSTMWTYVGDKKGFPDRCVAGGTWTGLATDNTRPTDDCDKGSENGAGINWNFTLSRGESTTRSHWTTFSPYGNTTARIGDAEVKEPASGSVNAVFDVTLEAAAAKTVKLDYTTVDDTATAGKDYQPASGQLEFKPGETEVCLTLRDGSGFDSDRRERFWRGWWCS